MPHPFPALSENESLSPESLSPKHLSLEHLSPEHLSLESLLSQKVLWRAVPERDAPLWGSQTNSTSAIPFNVTEIDEALPHGGLSCGAIHEMYLQDTCSFAHNPHVLPSLLAQNAIASHVASPTSAWERKNTGAFPFLILWIGRRCWPTPFSIPPGHLNSCLFIDAPTEKLSMWAIETALRSPAVKLVVAEAPRLSLTTTRRFALSAKAHNTTAILLRRYSDTLPPSAATTSWTIAPTPSQHDSPAWNLSLKRLKGGSLPHTSWLVTLDGGYGSKENLSLRVLPGVVSTRHEEKVETKRFGT